MQSNAGLRASGIHLDRPDSADYSSNRAGVASGNFRSSTAGRFRLTSSRTSPARADDIGCLLERLIPHPGVARKTCSTLLSERMRANRDIIIERMKDKLALEHLQKNCRSRATSSSACCRPDRACSPSARKRSLRHHEAREGCGRGFLRTPSLPSPERLFVAVGDVSGKGIRRRCPGPDDHADADGTVVRRRSPSACWRR